MNQLPTPIPMFFDSDGAPLENGYIYVGETGGDAINDPIAVYWDVHLTVPAAQPIRTEGGYPTYQGAPSALYISEAACVVTTRTRHGTPVLTNAGGTPFVFAGFLDFIKNAADYPGATVSDKINAAIADADTGDLIVIPGTLGAGEPSTYPVGKPIWDLRGANASGSGRKTLWDFSDANGSNVLTVVNAMVDPPLSHAAILGVARASGVLPNNRNIEGAQFAAVLDSAITGAGAGYIVSGSEHSGDVNSTAQTIGFCWGLHSLARTGASSTTNVTEVASIRVLPAVHAGSGTVTDLWSLIVDDITGTATNKGCALFKGNVLFRGDVTVNRAGVSSGSTLISGNAADFYYLDIGRASGDVRIGAAAAVNDFLTGTAQGDAVVYMAADKALWLGANTAPQQKISSIGTQALTGFYPPKDDGTAQTAAKIYAGSGAPNNSNGANGDWYFRSDGTLGANTGMYHKEGGSWVAAVTA